MNNISQERILFFFIKNFFIAVIYIYAMVAVYFSSIKIEGLHIGFYQMAFTIIHITILLLLMIINAPKSKQYNRALLYYLAGILAVIIGGYSYVKISSLLNWYL